MKRLIAALSIILAIILHSTVFAQTIGVILPSGLEYEEAAYRQFKADIDGKNSQSHPKILMQRPNLDPISLRNAARKLVAVDVELIVTFGSAATFASIDERVNIPIVFVGIYEPVASKIKSKNITGITIKTPVSSLYRYLRSYNNIEELAVIYNRHETDSSLQYDEFIALSKKYKFNVTGLDLRQPADITGLVPDKHFDAFVITTTMNAYQAYPTILNIASSRKVPTASLLSYDDRYPTITLTTDPADAGEMASQIVTRILKGEKPSSITPVNPKTKLIFNMKEANKMGYTVPMRLVTEATEIIY